MKKVSSIIEKSTPCFPIRGKDGYGGEQDGSHVVLSAIYRFKSRAEADQVFPDGVPAYVKLHRARFMPGDGWEVVFGWWSNEPDEGDENPLLLYPTF